ncbi:MAG: DUF5674 family protein [Candidatus Dojkabacteria bacterium]
MKLVNLENKIKLSELEEMSTKMYDSLVKAVIDISNNTMVVDAQMHADQEKFLLEQGSYQGTLWGINLYPEFYGEDDFIEFDSMINIRPAHGNRSRSVEDESIQEKIKETINMLVENEVS